MECFTEYYATSDGMSTHDYQFEFCELSNGTWRVYILRQPDYCGRADDAHSTHRLTDAQGRYICWSTPIRTADEAMSVAAAWADATQRYRRTGARF